MQWWQNLTRRIGAWPAARVTWGLALACCLWAVLDLMLLQVSGGLGNSSYDAMVRARFHAAPTDPRLVIIDIDEASLLRMAPEFGRWPWPRDTLATVLDHVEKQQPQAIVWDVLFSDADRLSPGGDSAFDEAARRSAHSHFSVVRLPQEYDPQSKVTQAALPKLWDADAPARAGTRASTVALIAPVLPAVAAARLGFNNGYPDADGVLRRYRLAQPLADGSRIQSLALSVARALNPGGAPPGVQANALIAWRAHANQYPRVSFADVFAAAEGQATRALPSFVGKIVVIGATASSLHDIHPTPLSGQQVGVDSLATVIDNAVNQRQLGELPRWLQALLAIALCLAMAAWSQRHGLGSLDPALLLLPGALLGVSYLSLNAEWLWPSPVFVDLHLPAGMALLYMALLRGWNGWHRDHWCGDVPASDEAQGVMALKLRHAATGAVLDALMQTLHRQAPQCRVLGGDAAASWPAQLRWPELHQYVAVAGPMAQLLTLHDALQTPSGSAQHLGPVVCSPPRPVPPRPSRSSWAHHAHAACARHPSSNPQSTPESAHVDLQP
jgi:CHASE2 domain-containing sensor protein